MRPTLREGLVAGCLVLAAATAQAEPRGSVSRLVGGDVTADFPAVGQTMYSACGGTLIGCETVLTAAHCALGDPSVFFRHMFFQHAGMVDVDLSGSTLEIGYDFAVLKLASPVTRIRPLPINRTTGTFSAPGTVVGWGCDAGIGSGEHIKRSVSATVSDLYLTSVSALAGGCSGDSGGAFLTDLGSGTMLAGTIYGTNGAEVRGPGTHYYQSLIAEAAGPDMNNRSCGTGAQAGDPNSETFAFSGSLDVGTPQQTHAFNVPAGVTELRIALNEEDNFNAFVRFGSPPTTMTYDCRIDFNLSLSLSCTIPSPQAGAWHVLVNRVSGSGMYQLTASTFSDCSDPVNAGIDCDDGNPCTEGDTCASLACAGTAVADSTACGVNADSQCTTGGTCQAGVCEPTVVADGTACTEIGDPGSVGQCSAGVCDILCPGSPRAGCRTAAKSSFRYAAGADPSRSKLQWTWLKGEAVDAADLGDPRSSTEYALCLYTPSGAPLLAAHLPAGTLWTAPSGATPTAYTYLHKLGANDGMTRAQVRSGPDGKAKATVRGQGTALPHLDLPVLQPVGMIVQLQHGDPVPRCWSAQYDSVPTRNDERSVRLRSP
ncbi:MAG: trypsin-like serine protease [Candidatus Binatia bacterium]